MSVCPSHCLGKNFVSFRKPSRPVVKNCRLTPKKWGRGGLVLLCQAGVTEWFTSLCCNMHGHGFEPPTMFVGTWLASMWIKKAWLPYWPLRVSYQMWIWGWHRQGSMQGIHPLKSRADFTRHTIEGISGPIKRSCVFQNLKKNCAFIGLTKFMIQ